MPRNKSVWVKRKLQTVKFKGREPRMLLWKKKVYEEWFHYAKLAQQSRRKIPRAFGNLRKFDTFQDWWEHPKYGFELFCEPALGEIVEEVSSKSTKLDAEQILLKVDLRGDPELLVRDFQRLLQTKDVATDYVSQARFQPSRPMMRIPVGVTESRSYTAPLGEKSENKLKLYRETYLLTKKKSYKEVALELGWLEGDKEWYLTEYKYTDPEDGLTYDGIHPEGYQKILDNKVKQVKRHVDRVEAIFDSIENGTFP